MKTGIVGLAGVCYLAACSTTALEFAHSNLGRDEWSGATILMLGWLGPLVGVFAWYANPLLAMAVNYFLRGRAWAAVIASGLALALAVQTVQLFWLTLPADEGNVGKLDLIALRAGSFLWFGSLLTMFAGSFALLKRPTAIQNGIESESVVPVPELAAHSIMPSHAEIANRKDEFGDGP